MRRFLVLTVAIFAVSTAAAQGVTGTWYGQMDAGGSKLRMEFAISITDSGYVATMSSPDQGMKNFPVATTALVGDTLKFTIPRFGAAYVGFVKSDSLIMGTFSQSGFDFKLNLTRTSIKRNRPQEPKPPYPYICDEVTFNNAKDSVRLAGTLTLPSAGGKFPCVVLVSGSGPQNRDEELLEHKPFAVIADYLTRAGIAVLRYDDRGVGSSKGKFEGATTANFMGDALSAVDFLMTRPEIDKRKIGILGHSEGGTIAFMAAAQNPKIGYIISLAGAAVRGDSILIEQNRDIMVASDFTAKAVTGYIDVLRDIFKLQQVNSAQYVTDNQANILAQLAPKLEKLPSNLSKNAVAVLNSRSLWMDYFKNLDPAPYIAATACPVMAINGSLDLQVAAATNLGAIKATLKNGKANVIKTYDGLNHLFQHCTTGMTTQYANIEQTIAPEVLTDILTWVRRVTSDKQDREKIVK